MPREEVKISIDRTGNVPKYRIVKKTEHKYYIQKRIKFMFWHDWKTVIDYVTHAISENHPLYFSSIEQAETYLDDITRKILPPEKDEIVSYYY